MSTFDPGPDRPLPKRRLRFGELLVEAGVLTADQLRSGLKAQRTKKKKLGTLLIESGHISEDQLATVLSAQLGLHLCDLDNQAVPPEVVTLIPRKIVEQYNVFPVVVATAADGQVSLYVAMSDPTDSRSMQAVELQARGHPVITVVATESAIKRAVENYAMLYAPPPVFEEQPVVVAGAPVVPGQAQAPAPLQLDASALSPVEPEPQPMQLDTSALSPVEPPPLQLDASALSPLQPEPLQPEPAPLQLDASALSPLQPEPLQPEPLQLDASALSPVQPEPALPQLDVSALSPLQPEPMQPEPMQPEPMQPEPMQPAPTQPEPAPPQLDVGALSPVQPEPAGGGGGAFDFSSPYLGSSSEEGPEIAPVDGISMTPPGVPGPESPASLPQSAPEELPPAIIVGAVDEPEGPVDDPFAGFGGAGAAPTMPPVFGGAHPPPASPPTIPLESLQGSVAEPDPFAGLAAAPSAVAGPPLLDLAPESPPTAPATATVPIPESAPVPAAAQSPAGLTFGESSPSELQLDPVGPPVVTGASLELEPPAIEGVAVAEEPAGLAGGPAMGAASDMAAFTAALPPLGGESGAPAEESWSAGIPLDSPASAAPASPEPPADNLAPNLGVPAPELGATEQALVPPLAGDLGDPKAAVAVAGAFGLSEPEQPAADLTAPPVEGGVLLELAAAATAEVETAPGGPEAAESAAAASALLGSATAPPLAVETGSEGVETPVDTLPAVETLPAVMPPALAPAVETSAAAPPAVDSPAAETPAAETSVAPQSLDTGTIEPPSPGPPAEPGPGAGGVGGDGSDPGDPDEPEMLDDSELMELDDDEVMALDEKETAEAVQPEAETPLPPPAGDDALAASAKPLSVAGEANVVPADEPATTEPETELPPASMAAMAGAEDLPADAAATPATPPTALNEVAEPGPPKFAALPTMELRRTLIEAMRQGKVSLSDLEAIGADTSE